MEEQNPPVSTTKKTARDRIKSLGVITVIEPISSNRKDLTDSIKKDKEVLDKMKQMSLDSLKYNHEPRVLGGNNIPQGTTHPLVEKYNPTPKKKVNNDVNNVNDIRLQRLKYFDSKVIKSEGKKPEA